MSLREDLRGVTPPLVAPFDDGAVDHDSRYSPRGHRR